jgi:hypothetical protein
LKYNKKGQAYNIIGRFPITDSTGRKSNYCRVKFSATGFVAVIREELILTGDFEDMSLVVTPSEPAQVSTAPIEVPETPVEDVIDTFEEAVEALKEDKGEVIVAHSPEGEAIEVEDLQEFVAEHDLELEAVEACLEGKQKTHKRWTFVKA